MGPQVSGLRAGPGGGDPEGVLPERRAELRTTGPGANHSPRGPRQELCQTAAGGDTQGGKHTHTHSNSLSVVFVFFSFE